MLKIEIASNSKSKCYLKHFRKLEFDTVVDFILELFFSNKIEPTESEDEIFSLIKTLEYERAQDIPKDILNDLKKIYQDRIKRDRISNDKEKMAYILLSKLVNGGLIMVIDNKTIDSIGTKISITPNSAITFYDPSKSQDISFKTL